MIIEFTDNDYAVIYDSLSFNRQYISGKGHETPNLNETIGKMAKWADPRGCQFTVVTGQDAAAIPSKEALSVVIWALIGNTSATGLEQACDALGDMPIAANEDAVRLIQVMRDEVAQRRAAAQ